MPSTNESVDLLLGEIRQIQGKLKKATNAVSKVSREQEAFNLHFKEQVGRFTVYGLICVTVMVFDFIVNGKTMVWLARMLQTLPAVIASILTLVDGFLAIMASGIFDAGDRILMKRNRRRWSIILWSLAAVKMIAYVIYVVMRSQIINAETGATLSVEYGKVFMMALPQLIFIVVIYSLLHLCGSGLWLFLGRLWFKAKLVFIANPDKLLQQLHELAGELRKYCESNNLDFDSIKENHRNELEGFVS